MTKITIEIDDFILPSFNHFYSSNIHYTRRSDLVYKWKLIIGAKLDKQLTETQRLRIKLGRMMKVDVVISQAKRKYDVDNCVMYGKIFLDCLKRYGIDDTPKVINSICYTIDIENKVNKAIYTIFIP